MAIPALLRFVRLEDRAVPAVTLQFDYRFDTNNFFAEPNRRAVFEQALRVVANQINDDLLEIVPSGFNSWEAVFSHPGTGAGQRLPNLVVPRGTMIIYPGGRFLGATEAGLASTGFSVQGAANFIERVSARGQTGALATPARDVGPWGGSITFDIATNWYFGSDAGGIGPDQLDFFSVAQHEFAHLLGIGTSAAWNNLVSGGVFRGPNASALFGGPVPLEPDGGHWREGTLFQGRQLNMDPIITAGRREDLTAIDYAGLADIGWTFGTSPPPVVPPTAPPPVSPPPPLVPLPPVAPAAPIAPGTELLAVGAGPGSGLLQIYNVISGEQLFAFAPFGTGFQGGVRTTVGDLDGDQTADVIAAAGPGGGPTVIAFSGATLPVDPDGSVLFSLAAFEPSFLGGVFVTAGDFNRDGVIDLVLTPDEGGGPRVRVIDGKTQVVLADFFGIEDAAFRGGARASVGDVNGDGFPDLIIGAGFGGGPRIAIFDGASLQPGRTPIKLVPDFFVFEPTLRNGVFVTAGDLDSDGSADLIFGGGPGGGPRIFAVSGLEFLRSGGQTRTQLANFFAGNVENRGGVRVTVKNIDSDRRADLVVGSGTDAPPVVTVYVGNTISANGPPPVFREFRALDASFLGGVFVG